MKIERAIDDFVAAHTSQKSSDFTVMNYRGVLLSFAAWVQAEHGIVEIERLDVTHLRGWLIHLQQAPNPRCGGPIADSTVHQYGTVLRAFCRWLEFEERLDKPITKRFRLPKVEKRLIEALTHDDFVKLLEACEADVRYKPQLRRALTARNRAIVSILFDAGVRRSELIGLRLGDIDRELRLLTVHRKGNKWQQVPISHEGFKPLHEYLTRHRPYLAKIGSGTGSRRDDPVFLSARGEPLTIMGITELFLTLKERSGIDDKKITSHQGRRYMATTQLDAGRNPLDVQRQMGHSTLMMTNRYYSQTVGGLKKSHEQHAPLRPKNNGGHGSGASSGYWDE